MFFQRRSTKAQHLRADSQQPPQARMDILVTADPQNTAFKDAVGNDEWVYYHRIRDRGARTLLFTNGEARWHFDAVNEAIRFFQETCQSQTARIKHVEIEPFHALRQSGLAAKKGNPDNLHNAELKAWSFVFDHCLPPGLETLTIHAQDVRHPDYEYYKRLLQLLGQSTCCAAVTVLVNAEPMVRMAPPIYLAVGLQQRQDHLPRRRRKPRTGVLRRINLVVKGPSHPRANYFLGIKEAKSAGE